MKQEFKKGDVVRLKEFPRVTGIFVECSKHHVWVEHQAGGKEPMKFGWIDKVEKVR